MLLGENFVAKVADFGMSRDVYERGVYERKTGVTIILPFKSNSDYLQCSPCFVTENLDEIVGRISRSIKDRHLSNDQILLTKLI